MQIAGKRMIPGTCIFLYLDYLANSNYFRYNKIESLRGSESSMIVTDKKLPVGVDVFEKLIRNSYYYLDKTGFIRQLVNWHGEVNLFYASQKVW